VAGRTIVAGPGDAEDQIATGLLSPLEAAPATPRGLALDQARAPSTDDRPAYRRSWFWVAAAGILGASAGAFVLWRVERSSPDGTHVITHF
jgi:hypothetical protein